MRVIVLLMVIAWPVGSALALDTHDDARAWSRASASDRARWAGAAVESVNSTSPHKYTAAPLAACLDEQSKAQVSARSTPMTLGLATALCLIVLDRKGQPAQPVRPLRQV